MALESMLGAQHTIDVVATLSRNRVFSHCSVRALSISSVPRQ
jgi:hypothetical protein